METHENKQAAFRIFFDKQGKAERVQMMVSSGDPARDAACLAYCKQTSIPLPRIGKRLAGQLWRIVKIPGHIKLIRE